MSEVPRYAYLEDGAMAQEERGLPEIERVYSHLTVSVHKIVLQMSPPSQIRQRILYYY